MKSTTITLSTKGQFALPKRIRETDDLNTSDVFRLERLGRGKYIIEKLATPPQTKARLVRSRDGFIVFRPGGGTPIITAEHVRQLESETL